MKKEIYPFKQSDIDGNTLFFIAGPCVIESERLCLSIADTLAQLAQKYDVTVIFKSSFDKANRTAHTSFRGPGLKKGLQILQKVKQYYGLPLLTDIHSSEQIQPVAAVVDIIQIPAFLCRQTELLLAAGKTDKYVNVKKGQFMAPHDMKHACAKVGYHKCLLTERGTFFGYNRLVVDFSGIQVMKTFGVPVIFDATHSVQKPGGADSCSSGNRDLAVPMAFSALCHQVNGLFFEVHPDPSQALCDGPNSLYLNDFVKHLPRFLELHQMLLSAS